MGRKILLIGLVLLLIGGGIIIGITLGEEEIPEVIETAPIKENGAGQEVPKEPPRKEPVVGRGTFGNPFPLGTTVEKWAEPGIVHKVTVIEAWIEEGWHGRNTLYVTLKIEIIGPKGHFSNFERSHFAVLGTKGVPDSLHNGTGLGRRVLTGMEEMVSFWTRIDKDDSGHALIWDREFWDLTPELPSPRLFFSLGLEERT